MATLQPQKIAVFEPSHGCVRVQRPIRHKIFVHSAPKTATSQLGYYLARLGYRVSGWMGAGISIYKWEARISATNRLFDKTTCPLPGERLATANATLASLQRFAAPDDAFHDSPLSGTSSPTTCIPASRSSPRRRCGHRHASSGATALRPMPH